MLSDLLKSESMMHFKFKNESGFSLVEVMIATGISVAMFYFLNTSMMKMQKLQAKMERRAEVVGIESFLKYHLGSQRSWEEIESAEIPTPINQVNFHYFPNPKSDLSRLSWTEKEFQAFDKNFKCGEGYLGCRVVVFNYQGKLVEPDAPNPFPNNYFKVKLVIETETRKLSRSFVPEIKALLEDTNEDVELRVSSRLLHFNSGQISPELLAKEKKDGSVIDPVGRASCLVELLDKFPDMEGLALDLCDQTSSAMPAVCFEKMKKERGASDLVALLTCTRAVNPSPLDCFEKAKSTLSLDDGQAAILCSSAKSLEPVNCYQTIVKNLSGDFKMDFAKICSRALDDAPAKCLIKLMQKSPTLRSKALIVCPYHKS